jgi:hypothetical protein
MEWGSDCAILWGAQQGNKCILLVCGKVNLFIFKTNVLVLRQRKFQTDIAVILK